MKFLDKKIKLRISTKVALSFIILVLFQGIISLIILTNIISRTQNESFNTQMERSLSGIESYLQETLNELIIKANLLAGQKKIIDYTDFGLKNLLNRELAIFRSSLPIDTISIYTPPANLFTSQGDVLIMRKEFISRLKRAFKGEKSYFISGDKKSTKLIVLYPIKRESNIIGVLSLGLNIDRSFVKKIEKITNSRIILYFNKRNINSGKLQKETVANIISTLQNNSLNNDITNIKGYIVGSITTKIIGEPNGWVFCLLDTKESRATIRHYNTISLISTFLILSLALLTGIIFYRVSFYRPFQNLLQGVHKISEGNLQFHFKTPAEDEFGELAKAFNTMQINLLNREKEISRLSYYNNLILENVRSGIIAVNLDGKITNWNPAAEKIIEINAENLRKINIYSRKIPHELFKIIGKSQKKGIHVTGKEVRIHHDGDETILSVSTSPLFSKDKSQIGTIAIFEDITHVKKLEEKLLISSRLAALGEMAAGVAHQIRNPLGVMKVSIEMLRDDFNVNNRKKDYHRITHMLVNEIDTLNIVISNFLDFARPREIRKSLCSIQDVINASLESLPLDKYQDITIKTIIQPNMQKYPMDHSLIEQVISNLVLNAIHSSPQNGVIEVRAFMKKNNICVEVQDWGIGMSDKTRSQIFNPFFTTKSTGTGLGLSIVHRIIEQHNGTIDVITSPGKGTTFRIVF